MTGLLDGFFEWLLGLPAALIYTVVFLLVFAEDAIFVGFVIPGETAAVLAGVASSLDSTNLAFAIVLVIVAAILGDTVGYEVGKHIFGPKILHTDRLGRILGRHRHQIDRAEAFLQRRGGSAVFLGRFTAFFRAMMPALAGASGMPYRTFLAWNAAGGIVWGTLFVTLGHVAGRSYKAVEQSVGRGLALGVAGIVVVAVVAWRVYESRKNRREEREYAATHTEPEPDADAGA